MYCLGVVGGCDVDEGVWLNYDTYSYCKYVTFYRVT